MRAIIGHDYAIADGAVVVHCQDVDNIDMSALVGLVDANGLVFGAVWLPWSSLSACESEPTNKT